MLLFQKAFHEGLVSGRVTLTFRRWAKPHVKVGGRYRCHPIGVLEVHGIARTAVADIAVDDAIAAGFATLEALLEYMAGATDEPLLPATEVWRVALRHAGDGDRVTVAMEDQLTADDVMLLVEKLARFDSGRPWTKATLAAIDASPRVAASKLALQLGRDRDELKDDIRKLKRLGLTQSFEVGYEISPRGRAFLVAAAALPRSPKASIAKKTAPAKKAGPAKKTAAAKKAAPVKKTAAPYRQTAPTKETATKARRATAAGKRSR